MPLSIDQIKALLTPNNPIPLVGLINKVTHTLLFAPCIPPKVYLILNQKNEAISGYFINADSTKTQKLNETNLKKVNDMLKQGYVPRLAEYENDDEELSAHELLFKQHNLPNRSQWGGFGVSSSKTGSLKFTFDSGAFNSKTGARTKGAQLAYDLQIIVQEQMTALVEPVNNKNAENFPPARDGATTPTKIDVQKKAREDAEEIQQLRNLLS